jgi:hypothetical protein
MRLQQYITEEEKKNIEVIWDKLTKDCKPFLKELSKSMGSTSQENNLFYRGVESFSGVRHNIKKKKTRTNRWPKDTPNEIHEILDDIFSQYFFWNVRSTGVFTSSSKGFAGGYGTPVIFFPIGRYRYVYSPKIKDLYEYIGGEELDYVEDALRGEAGFGFEEEYDNEYGEGGGEGHWEYDGEEIGYPEDVTEPDGEFYDPDYDSTKLKWIPDIDYDDFLDQKNSELIDDFDDTVRRAIKTFKSNDMKGALKSQNETVFECKEYYLVQNSSAEELIELIKDYR